VPLFFKGGANIFSFRKNAKLKIFFNSYGPNSFNFLP